MKLKIETVMKSNYIKYFIDERHLRTLNSDLGKFKRQLMNQDISLDEDYRKVLQQRFSHGTKLGKAIYVKYVKDDSIASLDYLGVPCYNNREKKIYLNATMDLNNPRGAAITWFHEHGHYIDDVLGNVSDDYYFKKLLDQDVMKYCVDYGRKKQLISLAKIDIAIGKELNDMHLHSAVSDLMEGLTDGSIVNISGHGLNYWYRDKTAITDEAFAHMFECQFDLDRRKQMKKYFPKSLEYFEKKLKIMKG
ncbi:MAG: hypothetical protein LUG60_08945 [Erysipelotrichaceae bacterium]|nr:hypothetical protein [Erysipelotrichaceae bacterium]